MLNNWMRFIACEIIGFLLACGLAFFIINQFNVSDETARLLINALCGQLFGLGSAAFCIAFLIGDESTEEGF